MTTSTSAGVPNSHSSCSASSRATNSSRTLSLARSNVRPFMVAIGK